MKNFSLLLERLVLTPSRNRKLELLVHYFRDNPDPDRGFGLAAITGVLDLPSVKPALIRRLAGEVTDEELFRLSYDFVGDLAETVALIWPNCHDGGQADKPLSAVVGQMQSVSRSDAPATLRRLLDSLDTSQRYALIKLATGGLRVGVSARLAKQALADFGRVPVNDIEELWHGLTPPYEELFAWLEGKAGKPVTTAAAPFRPVMLSNPLSKRDVPAILPQNFLAEWKWDGVRVQAVSEKGIRRLYSRKGDDISAAFPDLVNAMDFEGAIDGELLVRAGDRDFEDVGTFSDLQQRLNRKTVPARLQERFPAFIRSYDLLFAGADDLRGLPLVERRRRLEEFVAALEPGRFDLSPILEFSSFSTLEDFRRSPPHPAIEGLMLKRRDSPYRPGRPKGPWFKWKKEPFLVDAVLLYAQRGHGRRSGYYSDFTFGVWRDEGSGDELVPVGKAYFGFTDEELRLLDKFVRENTTERFGPVRQVRADRRSGLVLEVAFEGLARSARHKSGVAMRFPRISRIRWDKPTAEADRLDDLLALIESGSGPET